MNSTFKLIRTRTLAETLGVKPSHFLREMKNRSIDPDAVIVADKAEVALWHEFRKETYKSFFQEDTQ